MTGNPIPDLGLEDTDANVIPEGQATDGCCGRGSGAERRRRRPRHPLHAHSIDTIPRAQESQHPVRCVSLRHRQVLAGRVPGLFPML